VARVFTNRYWEEARKCQPQPAREYDKWDPCGYRGVYRVKGLRAELLGLGRCEEGGRRLDLARGVQVARVAILGRRHFTALTRTLRRT